MRILIILGWALSVMAIAWETFMLWAMLETRPASYVAEKDWMMILLSFVAALGGAIFIIWRQTL